MLENVLQLLAVLVIFILVLVATYYATKWVAKKSGMQGQSRNIRVIETFKIAPNKYIQIIQLGSRYYSIGVTANNITFLAELDEDQLDLSAGERPGAQVSFKEMLGRFTGADKSGGKEK